MILATPCNKSHCNTSLVTMGWKEETKIDFFGQSSVGHLPKTDDVTRKRDKCIQATGYEGNGL